MKAEDPRRVMATLARLSCPVCGDVLVHVEAGSLYESRQCQRCSCIVRLPVVSLAKSIVREHRARARR